MIPSRIKEIVARYAVDEASPDEVRELMHWYQSQHVGDVHWPAARADEEEVVHHRIKQRLLRSIAQPRVHAIAFRWTSVAAVFIILAGIAALLLYQYADPAYITVTSATAKISFVQLPDGSRAWLNASSELKYAEEFADNRHVKLQGEGYFEVKPDPAHPFVVEAGELKTTVIGTSFNVSNYPSDPVSGVSVITGRVRVSYPGQSTVQLTPMMQAEVEQHVERLIIVYADTASVLSWESGKFRFDGKHSIIYTQAGVGVRIPKQIENPAAGRAATIHLGPFQPLEKIIGLSKSPKKHPPIHKKTSPIRADAFLSHEKKSSHGKRLLVVIFQDPLFAAGRNKSAPVL